MATAPTPTWSMRRNLLQLGFMQAEAGYHWVKEHYFILTASLVVYAFVAVALGSILNAWGLYPANLILAAMHIVAGLVFFLQPAFLLIALAIGKPVANAKSHRDGLTLYIKGAAHILIFTGLIFLILGTVRIENYWAMLGLLIALSIAGLLSVAGKISAKIYITIVSLMTLVYIALFAFGMVVYQHPQGSAIAAAEREFMILRDRQETRRIAVLKAKRLKSGLTADEQLKWNQLQQAQDDRGLYASARKRIETIGPVKKDVRIIDLKPHILTGLDDLPEGCYTFQTEGPVVMAGTEPQWLHADLRLNGERPGNRICMDALSPPVQSFATGIPSNMALPQTITISFTWAP